MFTNEPLAICTVAIIALTSITSLIGFRNPAFREKHLFSVREILADKQYHRLFTSALLHADWNHLLLNMVSLFLFGRDLESLLGIGQFLLVNWRLSLAAARFRCGFTGITSTGLMVPPEESAA